MEKPSPEELEQMNRETMQYLINITSYILYKPHLEKHKMCVNAGKKLCKKCQEPQCDLARGGVKDFGELEFFVVPRKDLKNLHNYLQGLLDWALKRLGELSKQIIGKSKDSKEVLTFNLQGDKVRLIRDIIAQSRIVYGE